jgi:uncharacterized membrane protein YphA (DoxX/SURF4 family)
MVVKPEGSRKLRIAGWVLSGLIAALLCFSASGKFMQPPPVVESATHFGIPLEKFVLIGVLEIGSTILFLIPRTAFVGAILLAGYLGGATVTHLRIGEPWIMPIVIGVLAWVAYGLRRPDVILAAFGPRPRAD